MTGYIDFDYGQTPSIEHMEKLEAIIADLAEENDRLRAELARIKPSWDDAPEWANHLAPTDDIAWWWHENSPYNHGLVTVTVKSTGRDRSAMSSYWYELTEKRP